MRSKVLTTLMGGLVLVLLMSATLTYFAFFRLFGHLGLSLLTTLLIRTGLTIALLLIYFIPSIFLFRPKFAEGRQTLVATLLAVELLGLLMTVAMRREIGRFILGKLNPSAEVQDDIPKVQFK